MSGHKQVVTVLGATGSIGCSTLDVIARHPELFEVFALTGVSQVERLAAQCAQFLPRFVVVLDDSTAVDLRARLSTLSPRTEVLVGVQALCDVSSAVEVDTVMAAIVGAAGLLPVMAAARAGKRILLANKEALVMAGALMTQAVREHHAQLVPIDSEHNAIYQCLPINGQGEVDNRAVASITLTASGGPFLHMALKDLGAITPEQACAHPRWQMGRKISVDSATMMNKGLEVIEAHWLFGVPAEQINVVIHPQSIVHSLVNYVDGSSLAQLGHADMRVPIAHALAWPERVSSGVATLNLATQGELNFYPPDFDKFKCLDLAFAALRVGGAAPIVLNAANECAVAAFLDGQMAYLDIAKTNEQALTALSLSAPTSLDDVVAIDKETREWVKSHVLV
ncbi:1-deoxy-D-xylulose-5-phosphate reductoisomerase [Hydromonas duriensis]|uniref:1-deoxy-D-xylulose 5-phosphate reductoisomerase n=1 Tax=Hydromonas duriensis TaxID=1527608 RepID=A0A4R6Y8F5_9BURK|nr:1-deoxy-D-xylulose-5-phosphate reductoisomerase [Hydromonas duriensis]TDR31684.1 1-deoxy-D-xylulose 5-phosphate reductoisomerase [Hydromonas duriensis]